MHGSKTTLPLWHSKSVYNQVSWYCRIFLKLTQSPGIICSSLSSTRFSESLIYFVKSANIRRFTAVEEASQILPTNSSVGVGISIVIQDIRILFIGKRSLVVANCGRHQETKTLGRLWHLSICSVLWALCLFCVKILSFLNKCVLWQTIYCYGHHWSRDHNVWRNTSASCEQASELAGWPWKLSKLDTFIRKYMGFWRQISTAYLLVQEK